MVQEENLNTFINFLRCIQISSELKINNIKLNKTAICYDVIEAQEKRKQEEKWVSGAVMREGESVQLHCVQKSGRELVQMAGEDRNTNNSKAAEICGSSL